MIELWKTADAVCFDVDSTVCVDEGIDELAAFCGAGEAVAEWTRKCVSCEKGSEEPVFEIFFQQAKHEDVPLEPIGWESGSESLPLLCREPVTCNEEKRSWLCYYL